LQAFDGFDVTAGYAGADGEAGPGPALMVIGGVWGGAEGNSFVSGGLADVPPPKKGMNDLFPVDLQPIINKQLKTTTGRKNGEREFMH